jgi:hypothetical protein
MLVIAPGCSSGGAKIQPTTAPLAITNNSHSGGAIGVASVNNARDIAAAQPDTLITGQGGARDVDLSDDGGGGGGGGNLQVLTTESLGAMLQSMGFKPTFQNDRFTLQLKTTINNTAYVFPIEISVAQNHTLVWIMCNTGSVDHDGITGEALMNLLAANFELAPASFVVDPKHWLTLQLPITNSGVTPQVLGYDLKKFLACLKAAEPLYRGFMVSAGGDQGGGGGGGGGGNPFQ